MFFFLVSRVFRPPLSDLTVVSRQSFSSPRRSRLSLSLSLFLVFSCIKLRRRRRSKEAAPEEKKKRHRNETVEAEERERKLSLLVFFSPPTSTSIFPSPPSLHSTQEQLRIPPARAVLAVTAAPEPFCVRRDVKLEKKAKKIGRRGKTRFFLGKKQDLCLSLFHVFLLPAAPHPPGPGPARRHGGARADGSLPSPGEEVEGMTVTALVLATAVVAAVVAVVAAAVVVDAAAAAVALLRRCSLASSSSSDPSSSVDPRRQGLAAGGEDLDEGAVDDLFFFR